MWPICSYYYYVYKCITKSFILNGAGDAICNMKLIPRLMWYGGCRRRSRRLKILWYVLDGNTASTLKKDQTGLTCTPNNSDVIQVYLLYFLCIFFFVGLPFSSRSHARAIILIAYTYVLKEGMYIRI